MRILFIVHQFMPEYATGTEVVTLRLAKAAQRTGHAVDVLACLVSDTTSTELSAAARVISVDGIRVHLIPAAFIGDPNGFGESDAAAAAARRFFEDRSFDLVHVMHPMRMLAVIEHVRQLGLHYILTITDFFTLCYKINLMRSEGRPCDGPAGGSACRQYCAGEGVTDDKLARRAATMRDILLGAREIVACSEFVREILQKEYPQLRVRAIGHGVDLLKFPRPTVAGGEGRLVFGFLGTKSRMKGVHVLVSAFLKSAAHGSVLRLVGPTYGDLAFDRELRSLAQDNPAIEIRPAVAAEDVASALAAFDILCLPSLVPETFSLSLHEGFAAGLPALVSDLGHPADVVARRGCGEVVAAGDVDAWGDAMSRIVRNPEILRSWRARVPLPDRVEEECFLYDHLYRTVSGDGLVAG